MRLLTTGVIGAALAGCAASPSDDDGGGPIARCSVTDCLNERAVRGFEVLDDRTAIMYVGSQQCPFLVELDGFDCSLSVTPEIRFFEAVYGSTRVAQATGQICASRDTLYVYNGIADPSFGGLDPVAGRAGGPGGQDIFGGRGSGPGTSGFGGTIDVFNNRDFCRVSNMRSITDDELVELRVDRGAPPPPPIPESQVEVPETPPEQAGTPAGGANAESEAPAQSAGAAAPPGP